MRKLSSLDWFYITVAAGMGPQLFRVPAPVALFAVAVVAWFAQFERGMVRPMPKQLRACLTLATAGIVVACFRSILGLDPGVAFLVMITSLKFHELRGRRDYFILVWLASLLMLAEVIYSQNLGSTVYNFAGLFLVLHSLMLLSSAADFRAPAPHVWRGARRIATAGLPIMAVLFAVFPRIQLNLLGRFTPSSSAVMGFNDELRPGEVAQLASSNEPAFRATFPDGLPPAMRELYWRGAVLTATDGISWLRQRRIFEDSPQAPPPGAIIQDIVLEPHANKWLFALDRPELIVTTQERALRPLRLAGNIYEAGRLIQSLARLGRELASGEAAPASIVARALDRFKDGFEYTLSPGSTGELGIATFLFETKKGFCEHFASGLAVMLRAAGVPARVIVGFHGGLMNPYGNYLTVRFQDAHAWVEAWLPGRGWTRVDPTAIVAPQRIEGGGQAFLGGLASAGLANFQNLQPGEDEHGWRYLLSETLFFVDSVNSQWNVFLVSYDFEYQRDLLGRLFPELPTWKLFGGAFGAAACVIALILFFVYRQGRVPRDRVVEGYRALVTRLARRGVRKQKSEGPLDFAGRASRALPKEAESIRAAIALYVDIRYGESGQDSAKVSEFEKRAKRVA